MQTKLKLVHLEERNPVFSIINLSSIEIIFNIEKIDEEVFATHIHFEKSGVDPLIFSFEEIITGELDQLMTVVIEATLHIWKECNQLGINPKKEILEFTPSEVEKQLSCGRTLENHFNVLNAYIANYSDLWSIMNEEVG